MSAFGYQDYYVQKRVTELAETIIVLIEFERDQQLTHTGRNHFRYIVEQLAKEIKKVTAPPTSYNTPF